MKGLLITAAIGCLTVSASAQLINGSFESEALANPSRANIGNLTDWTNIGGYNLLERGVNGTSHLAAYDGEQFVSMGHNGNHDSVLEQTFTTVPGEFYTVEFYHAIIQGSVMQELTARVEDATSMNELGTLTVQFDSSAWEMSSFSFTAESASSTLQFSDGLSPGSANIALDAVSIVPEPASLALVLTGVLALRRRR